MKSLKPSAHINYNTYISTVVIILSLLLYPLLPFWSIILLSAIFAVNSQYKERIFILYLFLLSLYLGLINATKIPESDLIGYIDIFEDVEYYSFRTYIFLAGKEPVFFLYNYIIYYLIGGNTSSYIIITSVIAYMFFFCAINKFLRLYSKNSIIIFSIIIAAFFPQLFSLSAHLIRQFLAASILLYAIVLKLFYNKKVWFFLLMAVLIHSATLLFIPLMYLKPLKNKLSVKNGTFILLLIVGIGLFLPTVSEIIVNSVGNNIFTYAFTRVNRANIELEELSVLSFVVLAIIFFILILIQYHKSGEKIRVLTPGIIHLANILLIYAIFIIANLNNTEISLRFFFFTYFFFPLLVPLSFLMVKNNLIFIKGLISIAFIIFFIYKLEYGAWEYASLNKLLFSDIFLLTSCL